MRLRDEEWVRLVLAAYGQHQLDYERANQTPDSLERFMARKCWEVIVSLHAGFTWQLSGGHWFVSPDQGNHQGLDLPDKDASFDMVKRAMTALRLERPDLWDVARRALMRITRDDDWGRLEEAQDWLLARVARYNN